jgi:hypothetical protein
VKSDANVDHIDVTSRSGTMTGAKNQRLAAGHHLIFQFFSDSLATGCTLGMGAAK